MPVKAAILNKISKKTGETSIFIRIIRGKDRKYLTTPYKIKPTDWNPKKGEPRKARDDIKLQLSKMVTLVEQNLDLPIDKIKRMLCDMDRNSFSFYTLCERIIEEHQLKGSVRTAKKYRSMMNILKEYTLQDIDIADITVAFLYRYEAHLSKERRVNTVHKHLSSIRTVYYRAINEGLASQTNNPFFLFKLKKEKVYKDKLNLEQVEQLHGMQLSGLISKVRWIFLWQIYTGGTRIGDVLSLKNRDIRNGVMTYTMSKTGKRRVIKLSKRAMEIYYSFYDPNKTYLFDMLHKDRPVLVSISAKTALINKYLKKIATILKWDHIRLTSHVARHTFSHLSKEAGVDIYTISKNLGHSSISITETYLRALDEKDQISESVSLIFGE